MNTAVPIEPLPELQRKTLLLCLSSRRAGSGGGGHGGRRSGASSFGRGGAGRQAPPCPLRRRLGWRMTLAPADNVEQATAGVDRGSS
jgi:hypothetical protein